jgi:hypothetical protein
MATMIAAFLLISALFTPAFALAQTAGETLGHASTGTPIVAQPAPALERWRNYRRDAFLSPAPFFATVMPAIGEHRRTEPREYGGGWSGFGDRLARRVAQYQLQTALYHSTAAAVGTRTGYRRCGCTGAAKRLGYALSRTFVTTTDSGHTVPNVAYLGGVFVGAAIATETWYPDRYSASREGLRAGAVQVSVNSAINVIHEFGPELKRIVRRR